MWIERERKTFCVIGRVWFALTTIGYAGHYFFFDVVNNLEPIEFWFMFRMSMTAIGFVCLAYYLSPLTRWSYYKIPAAAVMWLMCYTQARVTVWYSTDAWSFCFIFLLASVLALRLNPALSLLFSIFTIFTVTPSLVEAGLPISYPLSAGATTLLLVAAFRTSNLSDVRGFLLEQQNIAAQKQIIDLNAEFAERIRAFIPKVIADRLDLLINERRLSVLQASVEVLRPETKDVACLFSDIRGFTEGSKNLQEFINESVIPEVRACSDVVEKRRGIPRKIGDLVFAYFDDTSVNENVLNALAAGMEMSRVNSDMNDTYSSVQIRRYILVSVGRAVVGNIGGLDSSMEITALGSPVNFLSRLDDSTKHPNIASELHSGDLVVSEAVVKILDEISAGVSSTRLDLRKLDVTIRDFPETENIFAIRPTDSNYDALCALLGEQSHNYRSRQDPQVSQVG